MRELLAHRYRVVAPIGRGGMGAVYEAIDERTHGKVAVKVIEGARDAVALERFRREARVAAALAHPHVVRVMDFHDDDGEPPFLVMERVDGIPLRSLVARDGALDARRACAIAAQVLSGLSAGHARGVVHRDVKPSNVLVSTTPAGDVAKIVDFGLARELDDPRKTLAMNARTRVDLTMRGEALGTVGYLAPEQLEGEAVGDAADIYAVGATLFYMIDGRGPFQGLDRAEYYARVLGGDPPRLRGDPELAKVVAKAMSRLPWQRFDGARAMIEALRRWLDPVVVRETLRKTMRASPVVRTAPPEAASTFRRRGWLVLGCAGGALGVLAAVVLARPSARTGRESASSPASTATPAPSAAPSARELRAAEPAQRQVMQAPSASASVDRAPRPMPKAKPAPTPTQTSSVVLPREVPFPADVPPSPLPSRSRNDNPFNHGL